MNCNYSLAFGKEGPDKRRTYMQRKLITSRRNLAIAASLILLIITAVGFLIVNAKPKTLAQSRCPNPVDGVACKSGQVPSVNKCTCYAPMKLNAACQCK
jgi:hypothetical protein